MAHPLGRVGKTLYKSLLKSAKKFDEHPSLKALICRNVGEPLPLALDEVVAAYLGGPGRSYFWPAPGPAEAMQSVEEAVRIAFRFPLDEPELEGAFQGLRYLSGLLGIAEKHDMLSIFRNYGQPQVVHPPSAPGAGVELIAVPERGAVLIAHPCLPSWFARSALLVCQHSEVGGSYALCVNKPLDGSVRDLTAKIQAATGGAARTLSAAFGASASRGFATATPAALHGPGDAAVEAEPASGAAAAGLDIEEGAEVEQISDADDAAASAHARVLGNLVDGVEFNGGIGSIQEVEVINGNDLLMELAAAVEAAHGDDSEEEEDEGSDLEDDDDGSEQDDRYEPPMQIRLEGVEAVPAIRALLQAVASRQASVSIDPGWGADGEEDEDNAPPLMLSQGHLLQGSPSAAATSLPTLCAGKSGSHAGGAASGGAAYGGLMSTPGSGFGGDSADAGVASVGEAVTAKQLMALFAGSPLFRGGPVPGVQILHCRGQLGGQQVVPASGTTEAVYLGCDAQALAKAPSLIQQRHLAENDVKVFVGECTWAPEQLQAELEMGSWALVRVAPEELDLFGPTFDSARSVPPALFEHATWQRLLRALGPRFSVMSLVPAGVWEDLAELRV